MNITTQAITDTEKSCNIELKNCCEKIANSLSTFNLKLANISNKLGLSKAIYQK